MNLQKLALGFFAGFIIYILAYVIFEKYYCHSSDTISVIISQHWKGAIGIALLATIVQYIIYNVLGVKDPTVDQ